MTCALEHLAREPRIGGEMKVGEDDQTRGERTDTPPAAAP